MYPLTPYPLTPIGNFIGIIFSVLPLVPHTGFRSWNAVIWAYAFWIGCMNVANFVDTIVWHNNVEIVIPVWCDIVTKLQIGATIGVPACALALCLHLFKITRMRSTTLTSEMAQKRRALLFDLALTVIVPVLVMALWIIVQPFRFALYEETGCEFTGYSYITYIIYYTPQLVFGVAAAVTTPFTIQKFVRHRKEMDEILSQSHYSDQGITPSACIRMMIIAWLTLLLQLPEFISDVVCLAMDLTHGSEWNYPYRSWGRVHDGTINQISQQSADTWGSIEVHVFTIKWVEWTYVLHAIMFFAIFGTTPEARRRYTAAICCVLVFFKLKSTEKKTQHNVSEIIFSSNPPAHIKRGTFSFLDSSNGTARQTSNTSSADTTENNLNRASDAHHLSVNDGTDESGVTSTLEVIAACA